MRRFLFLLATLALLCFTVQGAVAYNSQGILNNLVSYYSFDTNATDVSKTVDLMNVSNGTGGTSVLETKGTAIIGQAVLHAPTASTDANNLINFSKMPRIAGAATFAVGGWFRFNLSSGANQDAVYMGDVGTDYFFMSYNTNGSFKCAVTTSVGGRTIAYGTLISIGTLTHYVCVYNGVNITIWKNGVHDGSAAKTGTFTFPTSDDVYTGGFASGSQIFNGSIDELGFWNASLNHTQVALLYNGGAGLPFCSTNFAVCSSTPPPPGANETLTISVYDMVTGGFVTGLCLLATGTNTTQSKCNSTGSSVSFDTIGTYTLSLYSIGVGDNLTQTYYNVSQSGYVFTTTETLTVNVTQAYLNVTATKRYLNTSIASFNATNGLFWNETTTSSTIVPATNGSNNVQVKVSGNYSLNVTCAATGLALTSCAAPNIYDNQYTIGMTYAGAGVLAFNANVTNAALGGVLSTQTTTNGSIIFLLLQGYDYLFYAGSSNYTTENATLPANASTHLYNFTVYESRSISVEIRDEITRALLTDNFTVELISNLSAGNYSTSNGTLSFIALTPGEYTLRYRSEDYPERDYYKAISSSTGFENITLYSLSFNESNDVLTTTIDLRGESVEGATVKLLRYYVYCNCYEVVEMSKTSYSGQAFFNGQYYEGHYKWAVDYNDVNEFISTSPENLVPEDSATLVTRTFTLNLGEDLYEGYTALSSLGATCTYNQTTKGLSFTWSDPDDLVTQGCLDAEYVNGTRYTSVGETCQSASTGSVVLTLTDSPNVTYQYAATLTIDGSTYSVPDCVGAIDADAAYNYGTFGSFLAVGILITLVTMFSFSAILVLVISAVGLIVISMLGIMTFSTAFLSGFAVLILGLSIYIMRS